MTTDDRRHHQRFDSLHLLSFVLLDKENNSVQQGMGRTLNVSEGGILLETPGPIDTRYTVSLTIGLHNDTADIRGEVVYSRKSLTGRTETGISFQPPNQAELQVLREYIKAFLEQEEEK